MRVIKLNAKGSEYILKTYRKGDIQKSDVVRAQSRASNRERRRGGAASRDLKVVSCCEG